METKNELTVPNVVPDKQWCSRCRAFLKARSRKGKITNHNECPECGGKLINLGRVVGVK